jgi:hypothetical protein
MNDRHLFYLVGSNLVMTRKLDRITEVTDEFYLFNEMVGWFARHKNYAKEVVHNENDETWGESIKRVAQRSKESYFGR